MQGILPVITIVFVILKLCGVITWSWWFVFSPILLGLMIILIALILIFILLNKIKKESGVGWKAIWEEYLNRMGRK